MFLLFPIGMGLEAGTGFLFICLDVEIGKHNEEDDSIGEYPVREQAWVATVLHPEELH
ncbi:hypothetical protein DPMN_105519 [Dreissena polymorpha]|uniref:Uncharacterized protein n=1 Tax=Dreissena polymorpha TaxID=45954 RepID=A0A9D4K3C1_DREPO|nr:hypothetical protein DPMN_105519 [Dreissena polymorpha]